jgi:hypothetical protein
MESNANPQEGTQSQSYSDEQKRSKRYYDETGDLEIISSDNVLFKIHAYYLQASS